MKPYVYCVSPDKSLKEKKMRKGQVSSRLFVRDDFDSRPEKTRIN